MCILEIERGFTVRIASAPNRLANSLSSVFHVLDGCAKASRMNRDFQASCLWMSIQNHIPFSFFGSLQDMAHLSDWLSRAWAILPFSSEALQLPQPPLYFLPFVNTVAKLQRGWSAGNTQACSCQAIPGKYKVRQN